MVLIGIAGKARVGKDTAAQILSRWHSLTIDSFAAPIRRSVADILGVTLEELEKIKDLSNPLLGGVKPRTMMETLGTEWGRVAIHDDIWIISLFLRQRNNNIGLIISDVRYDNEAKAVRDRGGSVIHILNPRILDVSGHCSNSGPTVLPGDTVIINDGSLEAFQQKLRAVMNNY